MIDWIDNSFPLLANLPPIGRARGYRLYASGGRRFVDLWQYGGKALLGHTPPALLKTLKNAASRGLLTPLPHPARQRLARALEKLFPGCSFRIYPDRAALCKALKTPDPVLKAPDPVLQTPDTVSRDPAAPAAGPQDCQLWRPFWDEGAPLAFKDAPRAFVPVLPLPWMNAPEILVLKGPEQADTKGALAGLDTGDFVSPLLLAGLTRAVYDLIAASQSRLPDLKKYSRDFPLWKRRGVYFLFCGGEHRGEAGSGAKDPETADSGKKLLYKSLFARFLDRGFLLPPDPGLPAILPPGLSPGEESALISLLSFTP
ncbi:MAG: hypothetical protein LBH73_08160 [Spirochaetaceae bacterium]|jgi:hypothetical protein|nr:hypothetical protein [Spirochaetaceae bacterium]